MLQPITELVNFIGLAVAIWLGLYVITRNPHSLIAWLTGVGLWLIGGTFLNILLALNPPPVPVSRPFWLRLLFPFWPEPITEQGQNTWLLGWSIVPALLIWHHVTTLMRGRLNTWRKARIILGYAVAAAAVFYQSFTPLLYTVENGDPLYLNTLQAGPLYPFFGACLLLFSGWSLMNLLRSARAATAVIIRKQFYTLAWATLVGGIAAPVSIAASGFGLPVPMVAISLPLSVSVGMIGYGVARYSTLVVGRTMRRDFIHSAASTLTMLLFYLAVMGILAEAYDLPHVDYIAAMLLAIVSQFIFNSSRQILDRFIYRQDTRELQANLRKLDRLAATQEELDDWLKLGFQTLCAAARATYGALFTLEENGLHQVAAYQWTGKETALQPEELRTDDFLHLNPDHFPPPLAEAALLLPLYIETNQVGAIILGRPQNGLRFSEEDLELLLDATDHLTDAIHRAHLEAKYLQQINQLAQSQPPQPVLAAEKISVHLIEQVLRNLKDYSFLGDTPLAQLKLVNIRLPAGPATHIDRGKAVYQLLHEALEKLRPGAARPGEPVPRQWYPYLILAEAYLEDHPNRDIMARLYISEGTFNRTRRAALRSLTRILEEMEAAVQ